MSENINCRALCTRREPPTMWLCERDNKLMIDNTLSTNIENLNIPGFEYREFMTEAITDIFDATCGIELKPTEDRTNTAIAQDGEVIVGMISLTGDVNWTLFMGLPASTAATLAPLFAGFDIAFDSLDMSDAVGELTNLVAGSMKLNLAAAEFDIILSLPTVLRAKMMVVAPLPDSYCMRRTFSSADHGLFWCGLTMAP